MSHKKQKAPARGPSATDKRDAVKFGLDLYSTGSLPDCQALETPKSLDEQLAQAEAQLEAAQTDDEWVEIFLQWIDLHEQKMAVTQ